MQAALQVAGLFIEGPAATPCSRSKTSQIIKPISTASKP